MIMMSNEAVFPEAYKTRCFCKYCGSRCITKYIPNGFLTTTGNSVFLIRHTCPAKSRWFETHTDFIVHDYEGNEIRFIEADDGTVLVVGRGV